MTPDQGVLSSSHSLNDTPARGDSARRSRPPPPQPVTHSSAAKTLPAASSCGHHAPPLRRIPRQGSSNRNARGMSPAMPPGRGNGESIPHGTSASRPRTIRLRENIPGRTREQHAQHPPMTHGAKISSHDPTGHGKPDATTGQEPHHGREKKRSSTKTCSDALRTHHHPLGHAEVGQLNGATLVHQAICRLSRETRATAANSAHSSVSNHGP